MWVARVSVGAETMFFFSFFFLISGLSRWVCCYFELDVRVILTLRWYNGSVCDHGWVMDTE